MRAAKSGTDRAFKTQGWNLPHSQAELNPQHAQHGLVECATLSLFRGLFAPAGGPQYAASMRTPTRHTRHSSTAKKLGW